MKNKHAAIVYLELNLRVKGSAQPQRSILFRHHQHPRTEPQEQHFPKAGVWPVLCELNLWHLCIWPSQDGETRTHDVCDMQFYMSHSAGIAHWLHSRWASSTRVRETLHPAKGTGGQSEAAAQRFSPKLSLGLWTLP